MKSARVTVAGQVVGELSGERPGLLVFLGIGRKDEAADVEWIAARLWKLRIFDDADGRMNRSLADVDGGVLVISQFTLFGSLKKGNRPSYNRAAPPELAVPLYESFIGKLSELLGKPVPSGRFGAQMVVDACNDGPVTLIIDSKERGY